VQIEGVDSFTVESTQATMEIAYLEPKKQSSEKAQHWVAEVTVEERHCARCYPALKAISQNDVISLAELFHEVFQMRQIVTVVGVAHNHVTAARCEDAVPER
jgi:hypothetical protein